MFITDLRNGLVAQQDKHLDSLHVSRQEMREIETGASQQLGLWRKSIPDAFPGTKQTHLNPYVHMEDAVSPLNQRPIQAQEFETAALAVIQRSPKEALLAAPSRETGQAHETAAGPLMDVAFAALELPRQLESGFPQVLHEAGLHHIHVGTLHFIDFWHHLICGLK
eukprot:g22969.t1